MLYCSLCNRELNNNYDLQTMEEYSYNGYLCSKCRAALKKMQNYAQNGDERYTKYKKYLLLNTDNASDETFQDVINACKESSNQYAAKVRKYKYILMASILFVGLLFAAGVVFWAGSVNSCSVCGKHFIGTAYSPDRGIHVFCKQCSDEYRGQ